jgi:hypothetical protein
MTPGVMTKGKSTCHAGGILLTELVKARMRKSRKTANEINLAGLTPGHYMNYLTLLSDLRDSVLYIGNLFSLPQLQLCVYITFYFFIRFGASQLLPSSNAFCHRITRRSIDVSTS